MLISVIRGTTGAVIGTLLSAGSAATAATIIVTPANIVTSFNSAHAGDTLRLYGTFGLTRLQNQSFSKLVTLDASRAIFTNTLILQRDTNVKLSGGQFNIAGGTSYGKGVAIWGGTSVWLDRTTIYGDASETGISFEGTTNAMASNGHLDGLRAGINFASVTNGIVSGNKITHAIADGIDIGDSHTVTASYNSCTLGTPGPGVHPDCIQLWSVNGHPVQSDITVTHNTATGPTQGFTSFASGGGALRVSIDHNTVNGSFPQGIACYACVDSTISYNSVTTLPGAAHTTNINVVGGSHNSVVGNKIGGYTVVITNKSAVVAIDGAAVRPNVDFAAATSGGAKPMLDLAVRNDRVNTNDSVNTVPEPATWAMLIAGFGAVGLMRRRSASRQSRMAGLTA